MLSAAFGDYLDKRELQQAFTDWVPTDHAEDDEMWLDVIADTADGFNPTYTVAWCASQRDAATRRVRPATAAGRLCRVGRRRGLPVGFAGRVREPVHRPVQGGAAVDRRPTIR